MRDESVQRIAQSGFTRSRASRNRNELAAANLKVHSLQRGKVVLPAVGISQSANLDDGFHVLARHSARKSRSLRSPSRRGTIRSALLLVRPRERPVAPAIRQ